MFKPNVLHPEVAIANSLDLPFSTQSFDLVTASNLLFLLSEPLGALNEMTRVLKPDGQIALLNPSENLSVASATVFADQRGLDGFARETLINWAVRAESHHRWTESQIQEMFAIVGLDLIRTTIAVGPGFAQFACGNSKNG